MQTPANPIDVPAYEKPMYNIEFQRQVLQLYANNLKFAQSYGSLLLTDYFETNTLRILFKLISDYVISYEKELLPENLAIILEEYVLAKGYQAEVYRMLKDEVKEIFRVKVPSEQFITDSLVKYCRRKAMAIALNKGIDILESEGHYEDVLNIMAEAVGVGSGVELGLNWSDMASFPSRYRQKYDPSRLIPTGFKAYDDAMMGGMAPGELHVIIGAPKRGKCLKNGTKIRMFDMSIKNNEDIVIGDRVMGVDGQCKTVLGTNRGRSQLYRIQQNKGIAYDANGEHILALVNTVSDDFCEISVEDYLKLPAHAQANLEGYRSVILPNHQTTAIRTGIKVFPTEVGDWSGFEVDGDGLFLLEDFTVTHNSTMASNIGLNMILSGKNTFHVTLEISETEVMAKYATRLLNIGYNEIRNITDLDFMAKLAKYGKYDPKIFIKGWTMNTVSTLAIRSWMSNIRAKYGIKPDVLIVDYDDCLVPTSASGRAKDDLYGNAGDVYVDLLQLAAYWEIPILTFAQPKREAWDKYDNTNELITSSDLAHSALKAHRATSISSINFKADRAEDVGIFYTELMRRGESHIKFPIKRALTQGLIYQVNNQIDTRV